MIVYVDKSGEKAIFGNLFIKGENVTRKEAGDPKPRKIDMGQLDIEKSPFKGSREPKVTIVEFSNFQCLPCRKLWNEMKPLLEKYPQNIRYIFKHFPLPSNNKSFELSEIAAAAQEVSQEAFWLVHDFFFSEEGQGLIKEERSTILAGIEKLLKEKGYDGDVFRKVLENGTARKRVEEDKAVGNKIPILGAPSTIVNGDFVRGMITEKVLQRYLER